jgi:hypothetical protein
MKLPTIKNLLSCWIAFFVFLQITGCEKLFADEKKRQKQIQWLETAEALSVARAKVHAAFACQQIGIIEMEKCVHLESAEPGEAVAGEMARQAIISHEHFWKRCTSELKLTPEHCKELIAKNVPIAEQALRDVYGSPMEHAQKN